MSRATKHAFVPVDPAALILGLMDDGRERTSNDISLRIRVPVDAIQNTLRTMVRMGYLQSEQLPRQGVVTIYRKPQA
jgi:DNA-binding IclR family transcriptional regulator